MKINKIETYQYFSTKFKYFKTKNYFNDIIPFITGLLFMITTSMETLNNTSSTFIMVIIIFY